MKMSAWSLGVLMVLCVQPVEAVNREITALFQPDPSQPGKNVFVNKTPNTGYCAIYPATCDQTDTFSIQLPIIFSSTRAIAVGDGVSVKGPANWRQLTVRNTDTQETEVVEVRITGVGSNYRLSHPSEDLTGAPDHRQGHDFLWGGAGWLYTSPPCQSTGLAAYSRTTYRFFWKTPVEAACVKVASFAIPAMSFETVDFSYELRTPNPLGMSSGLYTGSISYTLGPGGDFDFGPMMQADDSNLTLDFVLDVQHTLKVDIPPGGNRVLLEPLGGWQSWVSQGRKPTRLFRDQMFLISASSRFKMNLQCQYGSGDACALWEPNVGHTVPLIVSVTLPVGLTDAMGQPVNRLRLRRDGVGTQLFQPGIYVDRKAGLLHFEVPPVAVSEMLVPGSARTYSGAVTIVWDSEVD